MDFGAFGILDVVTIVDWSIVLAGLGTFGALLWTAIIVPVKSRQKSVDLEIKRIEVLIRTMDADIRKDFRESLSEAIERIGDRMVECIRQRDENLARHVEDDSRKHKEIFDQNRELIATVSRIEGKLE